MRPDPSPWAILLALAVLVGFFWFVWADPDGTRRAYYDHLGRERRCTEACLGEGAERSELHPIDWQSRPQTAERCFCFRAYAPTWEAVSP